MRPATASGFAMFALASAALAVGWRANDGPIDFDFLVEAPSTRCWRENSSTR
jgi:hypothetical protein